MNIKRIKRYINFHISKLQIYKYFVIINLFIFHFNERVHKKSFGEKNKDLVFYVIRPRGITEGILSCYLNVIQEVKYARDHNYIPVVDYQNYENQYRMSKSNKEYINSWELFFEQVSNYTLNEVYQSKNVILSGWSIKKCLQVKVNFSFEDQIKFYKELDVDISLKRELLEKANYIEKKYINDKTLGLFIRGTDYVALKPKGHYIQPTVEMLLSKVKEYIQEFQIDNIFLITEDKEIENKIKKSLNVSINVLKIGRAHV